MSLAALLPSWRESFQPSILVYISCGFLYDFCCVGSSQFLFLVLLSVFIVKGFLNTSFFLKVFIIFYLLLFYWHVYMPQHACGVNGQLPGVGFLLPHGSQAQTQFSGLNGKCLYLLSHLTGPQRLFMHHLRYCVMFALHLLLRLLHCLILICRDTFSFKL